MVVTVSQAGGAGRGNSSSSSSKADMTKFCVWRKVVQG